MISILCKPYRNHAIRVAAHPIYGGGGYSVDWMVYDATSAEKDQLVRHCSERQVFSCVRDAVSYAEAEAHDVIDGWET
jgi:hypothetical protein